MDLSQYIGLFIDEARLHLQQCSNTLLQLEHAPEDPAALNELFRTIHTIKGMAATLVEFPHFSEISHLSHEMETLLEELRNQRFQVTEPVMDLLFTCVDGLDQLIGLVADPSQTAALDLEPLYEKLANISALEPLAQSLQASDCNDPFWTEDWLHAYTESESQKIIQASKYGKNCFELRIRLVPDCQMKAIRAQLIVQNLQQHSEIIKTLPELEQLQAGAFDRTFIVSLVTPLEDESILREAESVSEVAAVRTINLLGETVYSYPRFQEKEDEPVFLMPDLNEIELNVLREARKMGYGVVLLGIRLFPNVILKAARATLVFRSLEKYGEIIKSVPPVIELEEERFGNFFELVLITQASPEEIREAILAVSEIKDSLDVLIMSVTDQIVETCDTSGQAVALPRYAPSQETHRSTAPPAHPQVPAAPLVSAPGTARPPVQRSSPLVRVDAGKLEHLLHLVDELVLCRAELTHAIRNQLQEQMEQTLSALGTVSSALHSLSIQLQMVSVEQVFNRFPRMIRDLSKSLGKDIDLQIEGRELELDRTLIEELSNALMHMIRNAADHGLETPEERLRAGKPARGVIELQASYEREVLRVEVRDDGRGVDTDKLRYKAVERGIVSEHSAQQMSHEQALRLVFAPGLSTQDMATDISGRGVGMDAVRTQIESLGGEISIHSRRGEGTCYTILIPSQMTMLNTLLVGVQGDFYALARDQVQGVSAVTAREISAEAGQRFLLSEQERLPLFPLAAFVHQKDTARQAVAAAENNWLIIVEQPAGRLGLLVDELLGEEELILKPLHSRNGEDGRELYSGATVLENGEVALLLDLDALVRKAFHLTPS